MTYPRLFLSVAVTVALILGLINWPGATLAILCIGGSLAALLGGLWLGQCARVSREHDEEQGL